MSPSQKKLTPMTLVCIYPVVSTFLMTLIWQIAQYYYKPFFGGYYFKWIYLYTLDNSNWLGGDLKTQSQVLYIIYIGSYLVLLSLTVIALCSRRLRPFMAWGMGAIWIADGYWILWDMFHTENYCWQYFFNLAEHLLYLAAVAVFSVLYLKLKKSEPDLFAPRARKKSPKNTYTKRF